MKKFCLSVLAFNAIFNLVSQPWCPNLGAQWSHTISQVGGLYGHVQTTYSADTLIDGESWQNLVAVSTFRDLSTSGSPILTTTAHHYTQLVGNTVFLLNDGVIDTLYRFNAVIGDRWSVPFLTPVLTYVVTATGTSIIDGVDLVWLAVDVVTQDGITWHTDSLFERLGFLDQYINPENSLNLEPDITGLRCYSDADIQYQRLPDAPCDIGLGISSVFSQLELQPFPNPGNDFMQLSFSVVGSDKTLLVHDTHGRLIVQRAIQPSSLTINTSNWLSGQYFLSVVGGSGQYFSGRWTKE